MIIIIDNQDSFTYNLVHYFEQMDPEVAVFQNNEISAAKIKQMSPDLIVLSPGPGRPAETGATKEVLEELTAHIPILGVCLGHQAIVEHFGGTIMKGAQPMHGKVSTMDHDASELFEGISSPTQVARYHSLAAEAASMPDCLEITARTTDGAVMGVRHRSLPVTGIQFHPESIMTKEGFHMLKNACGQAKAWKRQKQGGTPDGQSIPAL